MPSLWQKPGRSSRGKRKWRKVCARLCSVCHPRRLWLGIPSFALFPSQVSLFLHVCLSTTVYAISPLWRVTPKSYWRMEILSKCKASDLRWRNAFEMKLNLTLISSVCVQRSWCARWRFHLERGSQLRCWRDQGTGAFASTVAMLKTKVMLLVFFNLPPVSLQDTPLTGRKADVIKAAHLCAEAALRLVKPGNQVKLYRWFVWPDSRLHITSQLTRFVFHQNTQVTEAWNKIAKSFKCSPIEGGWLGTVGTFELCHIVAHFLDVAIDPRDSFWCLNVMCAGMLSHQLKQHVIDGEKTIIQNPSDQQKWVHSADAYRVRCVLFNQWVTSLCGVCRKDHEKAEFEVHEVYAVDVLVSTGEGKVKRLTVVWLTFFSRLSLTKFHNYIFFFIRQRMEVKGPQFTNETPTRCTAWRWRRLGRSSVRWRDASIPCLSLWGSVVWLQRFHFSF